MNWQQEYEEYKMKYLDSKQNLLRMYGGQKNNNFDIVKFIKDTPIKKIKDQLLDKFKNDEFCDQFLGEGWIGSVKVPSVGKEHPIKIKNKTIYFPTVVKESKIDGKFGIEIVNNDLFIYSYRNIFVEAIILMYIRDLWNKELSPHLPLIIGYSKCNKETNVPIDKIITERHGLKEDIIVKIKGFYQRPLLQDNEDYDPKNPIFKTKLETLGSLFNYMMATKNKDNQVILPNKQKCDIIELCNYLTISYLMTETLLKKHNMTMVDMHSGNIFIHWLNDKSYMGTTNISKTEYIYYKFGQVNQYFKIKTFGMILKFGDVGMFQINPKKNVYIVGHAGTFPKSVEIIKNISRIQSYLLFLEMFVFQLSPYLYQQTIAYKILSSSPYNNMYNMSYDEKDINDMLTPKELLSKYFGQYTVDKIDNNKNILVI